MKCLIGGKWVEASSGRQIVVDNPATGEFIDEVPSCGPEEVSRAVEAAAAEFGRYMALHSHERARLLMRAAQFIETQKEELAQTIAMEAGKPIRDAAVEVARASGVFAFATEEARRIEGEAYDATSHPLPAGNENRLLFSSREPLGVVAAIGPFNFPLNLLAHKVAPALAAGNTVVVKPASETPLTGLKLGALLMEAGFPAGAVNVVTGSGATAGNALVRHPLVKLVSFTGDTSTGLGIAGAAAGLGKRLILEMGGMDALIVLDDADLPRAAAAAVRGCFTYGGQVCTAVKRVVVSETVHDKFVPLLEARVASLRVGDPLDPATEMGPVINRAAVERTDLLVKESVEAGTRLLAGGRPLADPPLDRGSFYAPTLLTGVTDGMRVACEEPFAPVCPVLVFRTEDEAVEIANSTKYGLQSSIFTRDIARGLRMARRIEAGSVLINDPSNLRWDNLPFGGRKMSGLGREGVRYAIREMTEVKVYGINLA